MKIKDERVIEESQKRKPEKRREENISKRKKPKKEDAGARKGRKVPKRCGFAMIYIESKSRLAEVACAEPSG